MIAPDIELAIRRTVWHPPLRFEDFDHLIAPQAAQLVLSVGRFKMTNRDERMAEMNREAQARWRANDKLARVCYNVAADSTVLNMLVDMGQILDHETGDARIVGEAIADMLAEAAKAWKAEH